MATYTSNYAWTKPGGNDQVDISVLNGNLDSQDTIMHKAFTNMAQAFSELSTYAVGDIVLYDNLLYKCHTAVTVAGAWTGSTNWQVYKLSEGGGGGSSLTAGDYIDITAGVISVTKEKGEYSLERYVLQSTGGGAPKLVVKKYIDSELISINEYANNTAHVNIDDTLEIWYSYNPYNWHYKLLVDGVDHSAGYEYEFSYDDTTEYPVDFHISAGDSTDLVTKGDLATVATSGSYTDLTDKPSINDQTPTFTEASTRNNIASGEKLSVILGKVQKFFNDLKTVAFSGNASDLNYDNTTSGLSATKVQGAVDELDEAIDNVYTATNAPGVSGTFKYAKIGHIVVGSGLMTMTQDLSAYSAIVMDLPQPNTITMGAFEANESGYNRVFVNDYDNVGMITTRIARNSGDSIRLSCVYLSNN